MANIIINGKALEGDFFDADFMEKYEASTKKMYEKVTAAEKKTDVSVAEVFRAQCTIIKTYFDEIFGLGTSAELFGGRDNLKECTEALEQLTDCAAEGRKEINAMTNKYTQRAKSGQRYNNKPHYGTNNVYRMH